MQKVLILGGTGLVGNAIMREMDQGTEFEVYGTSTKAPSPERAGRFFRMDVESTRDLQEILSQVKPQIVVSCLRGDFEKQLVLHTELAEYLKKEDGWLYYCSTANVFDQNEDMNRHHYEEDEPHAASEYGRFKVECEKRIVEILQDKACILRLPQIWGRQSKIMDKLVHSLTKEETIQVYPHLFYNTNTDVVLAKQIQYLIQHKLTGIFHLAAEDAVSHGDFYKQLITGLGYRTEKVQEVPEAKGSLALLSNRSSVFPAELGITNESVIQYLVHG